MGHLSLGINTSHLSLALSPRSVGGGVASVITENAGCPPPELRARSLCGGPV